ncbi:MAG: hypothetical protein NE330_13075 [Lentisphaeraceae bacterium]|nr:hypothetical protein [Lentisphaeraceae bacterium]
MNRFILFFFLLSFCLYAEDNSYWPPESSITGPGIVPGSTQLVQKKRRLKAFNLGIDPITRIGKFRLENGEVIEVVILPHSEILVNAQDGHLEDFYLYQHVRLRLHKDHEGKYTIATYIKDDLKHLYAHNEFWYIQKVDHKSGRVEAIVKNPKLVRGDFELWLTDKTKFWQNGKQVSGKVLKAGDKFQVKTYGLAEGNRRFASDVILDEESVESVFIKPQMQEMLSYEKKNGVPAYIQKINKNSVELMLFRMPSKRYMDLKGNINVALVEATWNLKAIGEKVHGEVTEAEYKGRLGLRMKVNLEYIPSEFKKAGIVRVHLQEK